MENHRRRPQTCRELVCWSVTIGIHDWGQRVLACFGSFACCLALLTLPRALCILRLLRFRCFLCLLRLLCFLCFLCLLCLLGFTSLASFALCRCDTTKTMASYSKSRLGQLIQGGYCKHRIEIMEKNNVLCTKSTLEQLGDNCEKTWDKLGGNNCGSTTG